jgi:phospholipid/cholesterol/gamma-HCH transport system ATP-binding protein
VLAEQKLIVYGSLQEAIAVKHPFILNFFLGERGLRALSAVGALVKLNSKN